MADKEIYTQTMALHLNGGSDFSELHYIIEKNGADTNIKRLVRTDGRPNYRKTRDQLKAGEKTFDVLNGKDGEMMKWIKENEVS